MIEQIQSEIKRKEQELSALNRKCSEFLKKEQELNEKLNRYRSDLKRQNLRNAEIGNKEKELSSYQRELDQVIKNHAYYEHQRENTSRSLEDLRRQLDSEQRWREYQKRKSEKEKERILNRKKATTQATAFTAGVIVANRAKSEQGAQTKHTAQNYTSSKPVSSKKIGFGKGLLYVLIGLFVLTSIFNNDNSTSDSYNPTQQATPSGVDCEYANKRGQIFSFHCSNSDTVVFEKTVDMLIAEWADNVALAEKTYNQPNAVIVTEGYIQDINKAIEDEYYILLSSSPNSDIFSTEKLRVYFKSKSELDSLLTMKKGDYATLVCSAQNATFFLEYPELEAECVLGSAP